MIYRSCLLLLCGVTLLLAACNKGNDSRPASKGPVLVEVNGQTITADDLTQRLKFMPAQYRLLAETPAGRQQLLDNLAVRELILQEAAKQNIAKDPEVAEKVAELQKQVLIEEVLRRKLEQAAGLSDAEVQKFYDQNRAKLTVSEQVRASHILVKDEAQAKQLAEQLKQGKDFAELAKQHSIDGSASSGGDLGWFGKGQMVPEFEKAAFALKEGEVSGPVKSKFGYHLIKLTGRKPAGLRPLSEVKEQLKAAMLGNRQEELFAKVKDELKKGANIKFHEEAIKNYAPAASPATPPAAAPATEKK